MVLNSTRVSITADSGEVKLMLPGLAHRMGACCYNTMIHAVFMVP